MMRLLLLSLLCFLTVVVPGPALADECVEPCPCGMSQDRRDELIAGFVLVGLGHTLGSLTALSVPTSYGRRLFDLTPVVGAIDAAVRDSTPFRVRAPLLFFSGVQLVGILLLTAAALHPNDKTIAITRDGPAIRF
jgi:hypothetical protein